MTEPPAIGSPVTNPNVPIIDERTPVRLGLVATLIGLGFLAGSAHLRQTHTQEQVTDLKATAQRNSEKNASQDVAMQRFESKLDALLEKVEDIRDATHPRRRMAREEP